MAKPSQQSLRWPGPHIGTAPVFYCNGDADDHLRLTVLLALAFGDSADPVAVDGATSPTSSWATRRDALDEILRALPRRVTSAPWAAVLVDPEALPAHRPVGSSTWDDGTFRGERAEFLDSLLAAVNRGGWLVVRPSPSPALSDRLDRVVAIASDDEAQGEEELLTPMAAHIVGRMRARDELDELAAARWRAREAPVAEIIDHALAQSSKRGRAALRRLAFERRPMHSNGHCGPFAWGATTNGVGEIDRDEVERLIDCGLVVELDAARLWVPRLVRQAVALGGLGDASLAESQATHLALASSAARDGAEASIESHWHANLGGDLALATATATYYVNDIRELARNLSAQGRFLEAATAYRHVVETDSTDAYAWEYLGYNLARAAHHPGDPELDEIENAYAHAHRLAPGNPLFHGRLAALRFVRGTLPRSGVDAILASRRRSGGQEAVEWCGWQIVAALRRVGRRADADAMAAQWQISAPVRRAPRRFGSSPGVVLAPDFDAPLPEFDFSGDP